MDLYAYYRKNDFQELLPSIPPRLRGIRLMKIETPFENGGFQTEIFNEYVGRDVIYIHTRCGGNNYVDCGMDEWEKEVGALEGVDDEEDCTYRDTYITVPEDKWELYQQILEREQVEQRKLETGAMARGEF